MLKEAIKNAEDTASQFANNSNSKVGVYQEEIKVYLILQIKIQLLQSIKDSFGLNFKIFNSIVLYNISFKEY